MSYGGVQNAGAPAIISAAIYKICVVASMVKAMTGAGMLEGGEGAELCVG